MLSQSTQLIIANLIETIADTEYQTESVRQVLCEKIAFEPYTAFRRISNFASTITSQRLRLFLAENDSSISKQDAHYLVRLFDANGDGRLSYTEFLNAVLTKKNVELRKDVIARSSSNLQEDEGLPHQVENALVRVFEEELEAYKNCERIRQELAQCEEFTIMNAFKEIDVQDEGYIDLEKVIAFMKTVGRPLHQEQIEAFMLRVDKKSEGVIRYSDFLEVFYSNEVDYVDEKEEGSPIKRSSQKLGRAEQYIDNLRDTYASPKKLNINMGKITSLNVSYLSPQQSTKMSITASPSFKTPTKKSASKLGFDEPEFLMTSTISSQPVAMKTSSYYSVNFSPMKESPMKRREEDELVKALKEMVENIRTLENFKNNLAVLEDFTVYNAFAIFDIEGKGKVNSRELELGFQRLSIRITKSEIALLMKKIDADLDGYVRYEDWSQAIYPKAGQYAKLMTFKDPQYIAVVDDALNGFSEETMEAYRNFLKAMIEQETLYESIRQRLVKRKGFNLHDAFNALDRYNHGVVTADHLKEYLQDNNIFSSQKDVNILVERYSKNEKGKVSYSEFIKEMTPKSIDRY